jgi:hypothetical protein
MWTVRPISSICASELDKDTRSCVPEVSVFTCSLREWPDHVTEIHVSERCFGACSTQGERNSGHWLQKACFFRVPYDHTKGLPLGNSRHYQVLVKLWMRDWWSVYNLRKKTKQSSCVSSDFFSKSSLESHYAAVQGLKTKTYSPTTKVTWITQN